MLMEKLVNLHLPRLHLYLPSSLPTCAVSLAGWMAGYSENIEWKAFSIHPVSQSVSHLGKGDLDGESILASGFDPRVLWQSLGLRNLESLFHRPVSPSTCAFMASPLPLCSIYLISNTLCIPIRVCQHRYIPGLLPQVYSERKQKKQSLEIQFPRCPFVWLYYKPTSDQRHCFICHLLVNSLLAIFLEDYFLYCMHWCSCTRIRSGLPGLGRHRWASLWMCSDSPAPISRNPSLCLATGAGSLWMQKAACNSGEEEGRKRKIWKTVIK